MCGIVGIAGFSPVNQILYDSLLLLQHRGQDAAGIATAHSNSFSMSKGNGLVRDVFRTRNMRSLPGNMGIGHVRYPTAGSAASSDEAQPFYVNAPYGLVLAHNGNLTNSERLKAELFKNDRRHINTNSDSEVLLNVLGNALDAIGETGRPGQIRLEITGGEEVNLTVTDTGPGLRGRSGADLVDPFFTTKEAGKGLGLGLSIAFNVMQDMGGFLDIAEGPEGGARVRLRFRAWTDKGAGDG